MSREIDGVHWLVNAALRSGMEGAAAITVSPDTPLTDAWSKIAAHYEITTDQLATFVSARLGLSPARFESFEQRALKLLPEKTARRHLIMPLRESEGALVVATADPLSPEIERDVEFAADRKVCFEIAAPDRIRAEIAQRYTPGSMFAPLLRMDGVAEGAGAVQLIEEAEPEIVRPGDIESAPVVLLTNMILHGAVDHRASDIHLEPGPDGGTVRFRVDGVMRTHMRLPMPALDRVVSRLKVMARCDIADRLRPHDGHARIEVAGRSCELRLSTAPTRESEMAVVRLLRHESAQRIDELGLDESDLESLRRLMSHRDGLVIVTGPTGSGKTTTLYAALRQLANGEVNIMTVEDPVEYELRGITQIQVNAKRQLTFAAALRAILRQDPDIILVGEIRDRRTAKTALRAALTGHLVLATLHTGDAASAIERLVTIGLDRGSLATSLRGVIAQRLVRLLCPHCAAELKRQNLNGEELRLERRYGVTPPRRATGCSRCLRTGYLGRAPVAEIMEIDEATAGRIAEGASAMQLRRLAASAGARSLRESALARAGAGETTLQEVERVLGDRELRDSPRGTGRARILVVDDDPVCREIAKLHLERDGFEVVEARDGRSAMDHLQSGEELALMLLDLNLPDLGGREVLARTRASTVTATLPVVVLTSDEDPAAEIEVMDAGADDYMRKPLVGARLSSRLRAALRRTSL